MATSVGATQSMFGQLIQNNSQTQIQHHNHQMEIYDLLSQNQVVGCHSSFNKFSRNRPSTYSRSENPNDLVIWLEEMENLMKLSHTPDAEKVEVVTFFLKGEACDWCCFDGLPGATCEDFKKALEGKFYLYSMVWVKE